MTSEIQIRTMQRRVALVSSANVMPEEIGTTLMTAFPTARGYARDRDIEITGAPFARYLSWNPDGSVDLEAGVPIAKPIDGEGDLYCIELPEGEAAWAVHTGPFDSLGKTHAALGTWVRENRRQTAGPLLEWYVTDPYLEVDPARWKTEVEWPVK